MEKISAKIVADSRNEFGNRITTFVVQMPRIILAELNTHRMFSRNSASSRAIPFKKMVEMVQSEPFIPIAWQKEHKGMQGTEYLTGIESEVAERNWIVARDKAVMVATHMNEGGITKQLCNRLLEPFMWHTVLITATEWENFFALRCPKYCHPMATDSFRSKTDWLTFNNAGIGLGEEEPKNETDWLQINKGQVEIHMMALAEAMWDAYNESEPKVLKEGEWHIPFGDNIDEGKMSLHSAGIITNKKQVDLFISQQKIKIATAMCARVSYTVVGEEGKEANYENDIKLHDRLATSSHWSPFEHCAKAMSTEEFAEPFTETFALFSNIEVGGKKLILDIKDNRLGWSGNFRGFIQLRKTLKGENGTSN